MCLSGRGLVVGNYVLFSYGVSGRHLCALLVGIWWKAVRCLYGRVLVEGSCVPIWKCVCGMHLCAFHVGGWW
jgi:hypothetical protein